MSDADGRLTATVTASACAGERHPGRLRFVVPSGGEPLVSELIELIAAVANDLGAAADVVLDVFPESDPRDVYVVAHELFERAPGRGNPAPEQLRRTIALCTEPPDSGSFELAVHHAHQVALTLHTNRRGCEQLEQRGIACRHLQLGYSFRWDRWRGEDGPRPVDVLHIGARDALREPAIGGWAPTLWRHRSRFVLPPTLSEPTAELAGLLPEGTPAALSAARTLLCLHHRERTSFPWPLALAAIANGCVLVCEHSLDAEPLRAGVHYVSGTGEELAQLATRLLGDERRRREIQRNAYELVRRELPLARSVAHLLELAANLRERPPGMKPLSGPMSPPQSVPSAVSAAGHDPVVADQLRAISASLGRLSGETRDLRRRLERIEHRMNSSAPPDAPRVVYESDTFAGAAARVSVIVSLYAYEHEVGECLASVAASQLTDLEVLVLDDASPDRSLAAARAALEAHPRMPSLLLAHHVNQGVGRVRNALIERARGELVFVLDADNLIFPSTLDRLVEALELDPDASFAYPMLVAQRDWRPVEVFNAWPWNPRRLVQANYIDAMALIRRAALAEVGGYVEDSRIGSEDHDLWCQMAERGMRGVLAPELLAVYRIQAHSKLRTYGGSQHTHTLSVIRSRAPELIRRLVDEDEALAANK